VKWQLKYFTTDKKGKTLYSRMEGMKVPLPTIPELDVFEQLHIDAYVTLKDDDSLTNIIAYLSLHTYFDTDLFIELIQHISKEVKCQT